MIDRQSAVEHLRADFAMPLAMLLVLLVGLAMSGQLRGFLTLYGQGNDSVAYSTWPTGFPELDVVGFPRALVVIACSAILIAVGTYKLLTEGTRRQYGRALAGVGIRHPDGAAGTFMRWMDDQLSHGRDVPLIVGSAGQAAAAWAPTSWRELSWGRRRHAGGQTGNTVDADRSRRMHASRLLRDLDVVGDGPRAWQAVNMARFARDRVVCTLPSASWSIDSRCYSGPRGDVRVFTVTDDPVIYLLTGQPAVWMANLYNASPAYEQTRLVSWIRNEKPPYAILDPNRLTFDGFQEVVRDPLVFAEVVHAYVPLEVVGVFTCSAAAHRPNLSRCRPGVNGSARTWMFGVLPAYRVSAPGRRRPDRLW